MVYSSKQPPFSGISFGISSSVVNFKTLPREIDVATNGIDIKANIAVKVAAIPQVQGIIHIIIAVAAKIIIILIIISKNAPNADFNIIYVDTRVYNIVIKTPLTFSKIIFILIKLLRSCIITFIILSIISLIIFIKLSLM